MGMGFMIGRVVPVSTYEAVLSDLRVSFQNKLADSEDAVKLIGLLFARPASALAKEEILPHLSYLHQRSKDHVFFYCAGYWKADLPPDSAIGRVALGNGWMYADTLFDNFREEIESLTTWHYSGGVDLILTNAHHRAEPKKLVGGHISRVSIDFKSAIAISLDTLKKDASLPTIFSIFEEISRYAESGSGRDPAWGFSDHVGGTLVSQAFKEILIHALPEALRDKTREAFYFANSDIGKKSEKGWRQTVLSWLGIKRMSSD
jgi:hypothetical protein